MLVALSSTTINKHTKKVIDPGNLSFGLLLVKGEVESIPAVMVVDNISVVYVGGKHTCCA